MDHRLYLALRLPLSGLQWRDGGGRTVMVVAVMAMTLNCPSFSCDYLGKWIGHTSNDMRFIEQVSSMRVLAQEDLAVQGLHFHLKVEFLMQYLWNSKFGLYEVYSLCSNSQSCLSMECISLIHSFSFAYWRIWEWIFWKIPKFFF